MQILREINFEEFLVSKKIAILTVLKALSFNLG